MMMVVHEKENQSLLPLLPLESDAAAAGAAAAGADRVLGNKSLMGWREDRVRC